GGRCGLFTCHGCVSVVSSSVGVVIVMTCRRQQYPEGRTLLAGVASNDALHVINQLFDNAQPQAAMAISLGAVNRFKQPALQCFRNAGAVIGYLQFNPATLVLEQGCRGAQSDRSG